MTCNRAPRILSCSSKKITPMKIENLKPMHQWKNGIKRHQIPRNHVRGSHVGMCTSMQLPSAICLGYVRMTGVEQTGNPDSSFVKEIAWLICGWLAPSTTWNSWSPLKKVRTQTGSVTKCSNLRVKMQNEYTMQEYHQTRLATQKILRALAWIWILHSKADLQGNTSKVL